MKNNSTIRKLKAQVIELKKEKGDIAGFAQNLSVEVTKIIRKFEEENKISLRNLNIDICNKIKREIDAKFFGIS